MVVPVLLCQQGIRLAFVVNILDIGFVAHFIEILVDSIDEVG
jgi:hypothetical protein